MKVKIKKVKIKRVLKRAVKAGNSIPVDLPVGFQLDKEGELVLPSTVGACADLLYRTREVRLGIERHAERLQKAETKLKDFFIELLPKSDASGVAGTVARVQIEVKRIPQVANWEVFYAHVKRTGSFELLQRRLNESAVKERWENAEAVPGVDVFNAKKVSVTKI